MAKVGYLLSFGVWHPTLKKKKVHHQCWKITPEEMDIACIPEVMVTLEMKYVETLKKAPAITVISASSSINV